MEEIKAGQIFRIVDLEGNQAVDAIFFNARKPEERYRLIHTMSRREHLSRRRHADHVERGQPMLTIVADTCGRHDTVGGGRAAGKQFRALRHRKALHARCRDNFLLRLRTTTMD